MRDETISRSYAETLFELAERQDALVEYGEALETVATLIDEDRNFRLFLATPRIDDADKKKLIRKVFADSLPKHVVNFVLVTIDKRRQKLLRSIAEQYHALLDAHMGREHVQVTVARPLDAAGKDLVAQKLSATLGTQAIPHIRVDPDIVGGLIVRTGNTIYDGSVRRRLDGMRRRLMQATLPSAADA